MLEPKDELEEELSEESCDLEVAAVLPASCLRRLDSSDWKERYFSLDICEKAVEGIKESQLPCQALVRLLSKEPGWNDTKLQIIQKKLHLLTLIARKGNFSKVSAQLVLRSLVEKIGDVICGTNAREALMAVAEACGLPWTAGEVTKAAVLQECPRTHTETLRWLSSAIKNFGFEGMEAKNFVGYIKSALAAIHPDVRASALHLLGVMYVHVGPPLRVFFEDEEPTLLHQIDAEFGKVHVQSPPLSTQGSCKSGKDGGNEQRGGDAQSCRKNDAVDIKEKISAELMVKMQDSSWKVRKEGMEELSRILSDVDAIYPSIGDLAIVLKACLHDSNKALVKQTLIVLQQLARVMGPGIRHHVKTLGISLLVVLRDSKSSLRAMALTTVEAWAEQTGMKDWLEGEDLSTNLKKENSSHRQGILGWLADKLPSSSSASTDLFRCVPHLYAGLEDSHEEKRMAAHEALSFFFLHLGFEKMSEAANKLKPDSRDQVLAMLEKLEVGQPTKPLLRFSKSLSKLPTGKSWFKSTMASAKESNPPSCFTENVGSRESSSDISKAMSEGAVPKVKKLPNMKVQAKFGMKEDNSKLGPIFIILPKAKEQRAKDEKALKVLRWNFSTPSSKYVEQLKAQMSGCLSNWLQEELFHSNFQHHIKALNVMTKHLETEKEGVISCLDLILKWLSLRLFDTNTWVLMKTLDYLKRLFALLIEERYELMENEASSLLPYLILKMGVTKESILKEVRAIVKQVTVVYPASRTFCYLLEGAQAKNANQRVGCLKELGWLLKAYGPEVCQPNPRKVLKTIITLTGDSNNAVHNAALRVIATARDVFGVETFKAIGNISEKHMNSLEGNIQAVEAKKSREEKVGNQFFNLAARQGSPDSFKQNYGTDSCTEEEEEEEEEDEDEEEKEEGREENLFSLIDQPEVENADEMAFCSNPNPEKQIFESWSSSPPNINMIIFQVASGNISTCIEGLWLIQEILRQEDKVEIMSGHINQFLIAAVQQLKFLHRLYVTAEEEMRRGQVLELYSRVICSIISLFQVETLAQEASAGVLKDLICSLLTLMLDSPVGEPQEGHKIIHAVNLLVAKVLEKSDQTRLFSSLLLLLCEGMTANTNLFAFSEMVAKCLWNISKHLPKTIDTVNLDQVLLHIHIFMKALPKEKLKKYQSSYPFRALKTLLHTLCKLRGDEILDHLRLIEDRDESELEAHLWKVLGLSREEQTPTDEEDKGSSCPAEKKTDDALAEIFKKINSKESARAGLEELYEYKEKYPEADLEPFLKTCSLLFRSYVKHGLAVIAGDRENKQK